MIWVRVYFEDSYRTYRYVATVGAWDAIRTWYHQYLTLDNENGVLLRLGHGDDERVERFVLPVVRRTNRGAR